MNTRLINRFCPICGYRPEVEDDWQVLGCREDFIMCPQCQYEFHPRLDTLFVLAVLDTAWGGPVGRVFTINDDNHSGKRLYRMMPEHADLRVTNACPDWGSTAADHGTPNCEWLNETLQSVAMYDFLLVCGKVARETFMQCQKVRQPTLFIPHPAARFWREDMFDGVCGYLSSEKHYPTAEIKYK